MSLPATDPRHGRRAGYNAGCRNDCCRPHHLRYQKLSKYRRHREGLQWVDPTPTLERVAEWGRYGISPNAIAEAAKLGEGTLRRPINEGQRVAKSTERSVLQVTWDDFPDSSMVYADLTRRRLTSAQAAGFPIRWLCDRVDGLSWNGNWRTTERISLGVARAVLRLYESLPPTGPSRHAATLARKRGHVTPAAWDDPGLPAMPKGWAPVLEHTTTARWRSKDDVDHAVVARVVNGERLPMTRAERVEVVRRLRDIRGWSEERIEAHTGITQACNRTRYPRPDEEDAA